MEENIDILAFLEKVMLKNTHSYQSDFQYDIARLRDAALESDPERRTFYWMSRPAGTWLVTERDAFLRGSNGYTIWTHYAGEPKGIRAYRVAVTGGSWEQPLGTVRKLNYAQQVKRVEARALPTVRLELFFVPVKSGKLRRNGIRKSASGFSMNTVCCNIFAIALRMKRTWLKCWRRSTAAKKDGAQKPPQKNRPSGRADRRTPCRT